MDRLKSAIEYGLERDALFIGMGDYLDFGSPSNRSKLRALVADGTLYDSSAELLDMGADILYDDLWEVLEPTKGRWLGLLSGHHYWDYQDGTSSDTRLAKALGCAYLGTSAMVQVRMAAPGGFSKSGRPITRHASFVIWAHHGRAGGKLLSAPLNQLEGVTSAFDADVYLVGHHHKTVNGKIARLEAKFGSRGNHRLVARDQVLACTGSFLKGYLQGNHRGGRPQGTYVEQGMMKPVSLGIVEIVAHPKLEQGGYPGVDFQVIS